MSEESSTDWPRHVYPTDWHENTYENPFYKSEAPVEVMFRDGKTFVFKCPRCARSSMSLVAKWRPINERR